MATVDDVAAYILSRTGQISTMKLQKLLYYCQGWSLAWDGTPLFSNKFEAWANGPVVRDVFDRHRGRFVVTDWVWGDDSTLTDDERETVNVVCDSYGQLSGQQLSERTHIERPWLEARGNLRPGDYGVDEISLDTMQDFFGGLNANQD